MTLQRKMTKNITKMAIYSRSSLQNFDGWWFWIRCSGFGSNALLNLISRQDDIEKIHLYAKYLSEPKYELLIKKREHAGTKHLNDSNSFIECSDTTDDVYDDYNPNRERKILIFLDDIIAHIMSNKNFKLL